MSNAKRFTLERIRKAITLTRLGRSAPEIATMLGVTERTVVRWRARARAGL